MRNEIFMEIKVFLLWRSSSQKIINLDEYLV